MNQELQFSFDCQINAPVQTVFAAITDQNTISLYFTDASTGPLQEGEKVFWHFGEDKVDLEIEQIVPNHKIVCTWPACNGVGYRTRFTFEFENISERTTKISVTESGWDANQKGMESAFAQCSGWTHFFASLKTYLEHGIDLKNFYCEDLQPHQETQ